MVWPEHPVVSTVICGVPWPVMILPHETVHSYDVVMPAAGRPPLMGVEKVAISPSFTDSGQLILIVGQAGGGGGQSSTTIGTDENATQLMSLPSSTSILARYVPGANPVKSHAGF